MSLIALGTAAVAIPAATAAPGDTEVALTKSDSPDPVTRNAALTYTIQVSNTGAMDATQVIVTDTLPGDVDFVSATPSAGTCAEAGGTVTCNLGTVISGTTAAVTIQTIARKAGTLSNTASVSSPDDTNPANNSETETTTVVNPPDTGKGKGGTGKGKGKGKGKKNRASCAAPNITGTPGPDFITGTPRADVINAGEGDDQIFSLGGKDLVCAGGGRDFVSADSGNDTLIGGGNGDRLVGGDGGDVLKGKGGPDRLRGQTGNDFLNGGRGRDRCKGGPGADTKRRC